MILKFVLDANIFVSALIKPDGTPGLVLKRILTDEKYVLILTEAIIEEVRRTLHYPKLHKYINLSNKEIDLWVSSLEVLSHIVRPRFTYPLLVIEDPKDDDYLIAALEGKAQYLISGDKHLLKLNPYQGIQIITAANSMNLFAQ